MSTKDFELFAKHKVSRDKAKFWIRAGKSGNMGEFNPFSLQCTEIHCDVSDNDIYANLVNFTFI